MLASAMPYKEEENKVKVGTNDPILMLFHSSFDWQKITGSVLVIIFYVENLDVGSWRVKNDV